MTEMEKMDVRLMRLERQVTELEKRLDEQPAAKVDPIQAAAEQGYHGKEGKPARSHWTGGVGE